MNNQVFLSTLLRTSQSCQITICSVLNTVMCASLRITLQSQLREYIAIEAEAFAIAQQRGWELRPLNTLLGILSNRRIRFRLFRQNTDSRIAEIMIRNNSNVLICNLKNRHQYSGNDSRVCILSQRILDCGTAHIRQLQPYL